MSNRRVRAIRTSVDAEIAALQRKDRSFDPGDLVGWAEKHPKSALHSQFEWDDAVAGHEYRLGQARRLLQVFQIETGDPVEPKEHVFSMPSRRKTELGAYLQKSIVKVVHPDEVLKDVLAQLRAIKRKNSWITELQAVWDAIPDA